MEASLSCARICFRACCREYCCGRRIEIVKPAALLQLCSMSIKATFFTDRSAGRAQLNQIWRAARGRGDLAGVCEK
jgi:hypothetical protein